MNSDELAIAPNPPENSALALPDHILFDVIEDFLDDALSSMGKVAQVCRDYNKALSNPSFWSLKLYDRFDSQFIHPYYNPVSRFDPRVVYQATHMLEKSFARGIFNAKSNFRTPNSIISAIRIHNGDLVVGGSDGSVKYIRIPDVSDFPLEVGPTSCNSHPLMSGVTCLAAVGNGIVSGHTDGSLVLHSTGYFEQLPTETRDASAVSSISSFSDAKVFYSSHRSIQIYDLEKQTFILSKRTSPEALPNSVSTRESYGIVGFRDKKVRILDFRSGVYVTSLVMNNWCLCVEAADSSDDVIRASDRAVKTFDLRNPDEPIDTRHETNRLVSQFKSDSKLRLVSCGLDGQVLVSSLEPPKSSDPPQAVHACEDYILTLDFDRTRLACGGINGKYNLFTF